MQRLPRIFLFALLVAIGSGCDPSSTPATPTDLTAMSDEDRLREAIDNGDVAAASKALEAGADANVVWKRSNVEGDQSSPLQLAATRGQLEIVLALLAHKADANQITNGTTPLHVAIAMLNQPAGNIDPTQQVALIGALIDGGADVNGKNRLELTPLDIARDGEVIAMLKAKGALSTAEIQDKKLNEIDSEGGGILGDIPDSVEDLKRREEELGKKDTLPPVETTPPKIEPEDN